MSSWEFDCPKFTNLATSSDESITELEKYFEVDHEEEQRSRRVTRSATAALAASGSVPAVKPEPCAQKPPSTPTSKAARRLARQKAHESIDIYREKNTPGDAPTELNSEPATEESLPLRELTGQSSEKENQNVSVKTEKTEDRGAPTSNAASKERTWTKKKLEAQRSALKSVDASVAAVRIDRAASEVSKPIVLSAVKMSGAPLDGKKSILPLSVRQHAPPSVICKSAASVPVRKVVTPALRKPAAVPAAQLQSLAEFVGKFHSKTPTRFRRVPKDPGGERRDVVFKKPTIPVTPKLATQLRSRTVPLRDQKRKAEEVSFCASNQKKPKVEAVRVNVKVAPVSKLALHAKKAEQDLLVSKLSAKPPQKKLANAATSRNVSKRVTVAKSPAFALKLRSETWKQRKQVEQTTLGMQIKTTVDGIRTQPCRKQDRAKGTSLALQQKSRQATADKRISSGKSVQTPSSRNGSQEGNSSVSSDKLRTMASVAAKEQSGTKGGGKKKRPLAAAKIIHRRSSSHSISTNLKPLPPQGKKETLLRPAKTRRSRNVQAPGKSSLKNQPKHGGPLAEKGSSQESKDAQAAGRTSINQRKETAKIDTQYHPTGRPRQKAKNKTLMKDRTPSSSATEMDKFKAIRFKAKPAPDSSRVFRLRSTSAPLTKPKPFRLASVERHKESLMEFQKKKDRMEAERLEKTKFVARPVPRSIKERSKSVDNTGAGTAKPGPSEHVSRPRRR